MFMRITISILVLLVLISCSDHSTYVQVDNKINTKSSVRFVAITHMGSSYPLIPYSLNYGGSNIEIYTGDIDDYNKPRLTFNDRSGRKISFLPDGKKLLFFNLYTNNKLLLTMQMHTDTVNLCV
jgi:hypothetical protein